MWFLDTIKEKLWFWDQEQEDNKDKVQSPIKKLNNQVSAVENTVDILSNPIGNQQINGWQSIDFFNNPITNPFPNIRNIANIQPIPSLWITDTSNIATEKLDVQPVQQQQVVDLEPFQQDITDPLWLNKILENQQQSVIKQPSPLQQPDIVKNEQIIKEWLKLWEKADQSILWTLIDISSRVVPSVWWAISWIWIDNILKESWISQIEKQYLPTPIWQQEVYNEDNINILSQWLQWLLNNYNNTKDTIDKQIIDAWNTGEYSAERLSAEKDRLYNDLKWQVTKIANDNLQSLWLKGELSFDNIQKIWWLWWVKEKTAEKIQSFKSEEDKKAVIDYAKAVEEQTQKAFISPNDVKDIVAAWNQEWLSSYFEIYNNNISPKLQQMNVDLSKAKEAYDNKISKYEKWSKEYIEAENRWKSAQDTYLSAYKTLDLSAELIKTNLIEQYKNPDKTWLSNVWFIDDKANDEFIKKYPETNQYIKDWMSKEDAVSYFIKKPLIDNIVSRWLEADKSYSSWLEPRLFWTMQVNQLLNIAEQITDSDWMMNSLWDIMKSVGTAVNVATTPLRLIVDAPLKSSLDDIWFLAESQRPNYTATGRKKIDQWLLNLYDYAPEIVETLWSFWAVSKVERFLEWWQLARNLAWVSRVALNLAEDWKIVSTLADTTSLASKLSKLWNWSSRILARYITQDMLMWGMIESRDVNTYWWADLAVDALLWSVFSVYDDIKFFRWVDEEINVAKSVRERWAKTDAEKQLVVDTIKAGKEDTLSPVDQWVASMVKKYWDTRSTRLYKQAEEALQQWESITVDDITQAYKLLSLSDTVTSLVPAQSAKALYLIYQQAQSRNNILGTIGRAFSNVLWWVSPSRLDESSLKALIVNNEQELIKKASEFNIMWPWAIFKKADIKDTIRWLELLKKWVINASNNTNFWQLLVKIWDRNDQVLKAIEWDVKNEATTIADILKRWIKKWEWEWQFIVNVWRKDWKDAIVEIVNIKWKNYLAEKKWVSISDISKDIEKIANKEWISKVNISANDRAKIVDKLAESKNITKSQAEIEFDSATAKVSWDRVSLVADENDKAIKQIEYLEWEWQSRVDALVSSVMEWIKDDDWRLTKIMQSFSEAVVSKNIVC